MITGQNWCYRISADLFLSLPENNVVRDQFISEQLIPSRSHSLELGRLTRFSYPWADSTYTSLVMVVPVLENCFNCKISQSAPSEKQMSHSCCCTVEDSLSWVVSDQPARYCSKDERGGGARTLIWRYFGSSCYAAHSHYSVSRFVTADSADAK